MHQKSITIINSGFRNAKLISEKKFPENYKKIKNCLEDLDEFFESVSDIYPAESVLFEKLDFNNISKKLAHHSEILESILDEHLESLEELKYYYLKHPFFLPLLSDLLNKKGFDFNILHLIESPNHIFNSSFEFTESAFPVLQYYFKLLCTFELSPKQQNSFFNQKQFINHDFKGGIEKHLQKQFLKLKEENISNKKIPDLSIEVFEFISNNNKLDLWKTEDWKKFKSRLSKFQQALLSKNEKTKAENKSLDKAQHKTDQNAGLKIRDLQIADLNALNKKLNKKSKKLSKKYYKLKGQFKSSKDQDLKIKELENQIQLLKDDLHNKTFENRQNSQKVNNLQHKINISNNRVNQYNALFNYMQLIKKEISSFEETIGQLESNSQKIEIQRKLNAFRELVQLENTDVLNPPPFESLKIRTDIWQEYLESLTTFNTAHNKPVVLFVAPELPDYDTSSGGKRATRMLALMAEEFDVYVFTFGKKIQKYIDKMESIGVKILTNRPPSSLNWDTYQFQDVQQQLKRVDSIIYAWYTTWESGHKLAEVYPQARLIFDSVDVHWLRHERLIGIDPSFTNQIVEDLKQKEIAAYKKANVIWAVTQEDKEEILYEIPTADVRVVSNIHDIEVEKFVERPNKNILFLGGYKHTPNLSAAMKLANEIFPKVKAKIPEAKLILAGSHAPQKIVNLGLQDGVEFEGFIEEEDLPALYQNAKLTAIPLLAGAGIKGKICEAIAHSLPVLTNSIGNEGINLEHAVSGLITNDYDEMAELCIDALNDQFDLKSMCLNAQDKLNALVGPQEVKKQMVNSIQNEVSICIVTWNRLELLKKCIQSVLELTRYPKYKILVHSNGCEDGTQEYLKELAEKDQRIVPILSKENEVFVIPNNKMMMQFPDNDVVLLNNDTYVTENWLTALVEAAYDSPTTGISGSKILYPDGRLQEFGSELYNNFSGRNIGKFQDPTLEEYNRTMEVGYVSGCSLYIKRSTIDKLGVFDMQFHPCYCEDSDYCYSAWEHDIATVVTPHSVIYHEEGGTSGTDTSSGFKAYQEVNFKKFFEKHKGLINTIDWKMDDISLKDWHSSIQNKYEDETGQLLLNGTFIETGSIEKPYSFTANDYRSYRQYLIDFKPQLRKRLKIEKMLTGHHPAAFEFEAKNPLTNKLASLSVNEDRPLQIGGMQMPDYKESLYDPTTGTNSRLRAVSLMIKDALEGKKEAKLYLTEQNTQFFQTISTFHEPTIGSEFMGEVVESGTQIENITHQNLADLRYKDASFDLIVSLDKIQLYPDFKSVLKQLHRALKPGGELIITVPFAIKKRKNILRASYRPFEEAIHHLPPQYFPSTGIKGDKRLAYHFFGWEFLQNLQDCGFKSVNANFIWSLYYGIFGPETTVITAKR